MKKIILSLALSVSVCLSSFAQKDLTGTYYNMFDICLQIEGDEFKLIMPNSARSGWWSSDIMAEGRIKRVCEHFIELNSTSPHDIADEGFKMTQVLDSTVKDSIKITFSIPYKRKDLEISVSSKPPIRFDSFDLNYSENNRELMIPGNAKKIIFSISPLHTPLHSIEGLHYGILFYHSGEYAIKENINHITIEIPAMDDSFFEKYYVKNEYARVTKKTIIWKGDTYIKEK